MLRNLSKYGAQRVTAETSKGTITFRSKFEYRFSVYIEFLDRAGDAVDWGYEDERYLFEFQHGPYNNTRKYLPDFWIKTKSGDIEIIEIKGAFSSIDYTKCKKFAEAHPDLPFILVFANLRNTKSSGTQFRRAQRIEKHINRVIYDAQKTLLNPISRLFEF